MEFRRKAGIPAENRRKNRRKIAGIPAISMVRSGTVISQLQFKLVQYEFEFEIR
jgi:hypothetical protein